MDEEKRIGSDPLALDWIGDSRSEQPVEKPSKSSAADKQSKPSKQRLQEPKKTTQAGMKEGWTRATFIVREETLSNLKNNSYWSRKEIKKIVDQALTDYLKGKNVKAIPEE